VPTFVSLFVANAQAPHFFLASLPPTRPQDTAGATTTVSDAENQCTPDRATMVRRLLS
jgi:hypothetical protein